MNTMCHKQCYNDDNDILKETMLLGRSVEKSLVTCTREISPVSCENANHFVEVTRNSVPFRLQQNAATSPRALEGTVDQPAPE